MLWLSTVKDRGSKSVKFSWLKTDHTLQIIMQKKSGFEISFFKKKRTLFTRRLLMRHPIVPPNNVLGSSDGSGKPIKTLGYLDKTYKIS